MALIEDVLAEFPPERRRLRVDFDRCADGGCVARAVLKVSAGVTLAVQTDGKARDHDAVIAQLADRLAEAARATRFADA